MHPAIGNKSYSVLFLGFALLFFFIKNPPSSLQNIAQQTPESLYDITVKVHLCNRSFFVSIFSYLTHSVSLGFFFLRRPSYSWEFRTLLILICSFLMMPIRPFFKGVLLDLLVWSYILRLYAYIILPNSSVFSYSCTLSFSSSFFPFDALIFENKELFVLILLILSVDFRVFFWFNFHFFILHFLIASS